MSKCNCADKGESMGSEVPEVTSYDGGQITTLTDASVTALTGLSVAAKAATAGQGAKTQIHVPTEGGLLVSSSYASGNEGTVVLRGHIGPFPYELHLKLKLENQKVFVELTLTKPFAYGPVKWEFDLGGVTFNSAGTEIIGATSITPSASMPAAQVGALGLNWWCVLRCGGLTILGILVKCLPALGGGIPGYIACVTAQAGSGAAGIAVCIAKKCA